MTDSSPELCSAIYPRRRAGILQRALWHAGKLWRDWASRQTALRLLELAERYEAHQPSVAADYRAAAKARLDAASPARSADRTQASPAAAAPRPLQALPLELR